MKSLTRIAIVVVLAGCARSEDTHPQTGGAGAGDPSGRGGGAAGATGEGGAAGRGAAGSGVAGTIGVAGTTGVAGMSVAGSGGSVAGRGGGAAGSGRGGGAGGRAGTGAGGRAGNGTGGSAGGAAGSNGSAGVCGGPACGPTVTQFFDNDKLATIRITFDAADTGTYTPAQWLDLLWSKWNHCGPYEKSDFVRVTFQYESPDGVGNATLTDVGIRLRGSMKRNYNQLAGFKLDFERWRSTTTGTARRRFADLNRIDALSIEADPTHMIQCLAYKMMRDFGQPAPYCTHLKVYVNGTYYGLMESVEEPDNGRFLDHHFGSNTGDIYEGSPSQGDCTGAMQFKDSQAKLLYSGDSFSSYTSQYEIERGTTADAEAHLIPMIKCGDATQTSSDATFKTCIQEWLDVPEWLRQIAAESLMPTVESFFVERNYILYFVPDATAPHGGRFRISSWDLDNSFQRATCYPSSCDPFTSTASYFGPAGTRAKLATRLTTVFKTEYCQAMRDFLTNVYKPGAVDTMSTLIQPAMQNEPVTPYATWQQNVMTMRNYIMSHQTSATTQVNTACN